MVGEIETIAGGPQICNHILTTALNEPMLKKPRVDRSITFDDSDLEGVRTPHQDPLVINAGIGDPCYNVKRILIDNGSSVDVLFYSTFLNMGLVRDNLQPAAGPLYGFDNRPVQVEGSITLPVTLGEFPKQATHKIQFIVVKSESAYNAIFGRPLQSIFGAITSVTHLKVKFPTPAGIGVVNGNQQIAQSCYLRQAQPYPSTTLNIENFDLRDEDISERASPVEDLVSISIAEEYPSRTVQIGSLLSEDQKVEYVEFLRKNQDIFAWSPFDIIGINPEVITHSLKIDSTFKPVIQKKRNFAPERLQVIEQEVDKLLEANFIREVHYPTWLANVVLVKKASGAWRMCVDYTDLNKACPKDSFPLPRIDQLVDATSGHQMLSFMDAYSGYNQIKMNSIDEEATSFRTDKGLYCYQVMPFGLKNAGATYQRLMNKVFKDLIGRTMEVYVDDMLVKSLESSQHISNLEQCFRLLRQYNMRLNPTKCAFGVTSGKFLGFMVTHRGIEANPEKIKALRDMSPPKTIKEVQRLTGRIAALSRFLARSGDKYLPFFKTLRGARNNGFQWTDECQTSFEQLRTYLSSPPLLSKPTQGETLYMYLAISPYALSSVLVREEEMVQRPVYYVSKILSDTEGRYPPSDKTALALVFSARKLRPYFQAHTINVYTHLPLRAILQRPETSGRLIKWAVELGEFDINFLPRPDIKSQVLADFVVECTIPMSIEQPIASPQIPRWTLYVDGASSSSGAGAGILLISPDQITLEYGLRLKFSATNNIAEYEALVAGLRLAIDCEVQNLIVYTDSQLVVSQVEGDFDTRHPQLAQYCILVQSLISQINTSQIIHILREQNTRADALSKLATSTTGDLFKRRCIEDINYPSIPGPWVIQPIEESNELSWMDPIMSFLQKGTLPEDPNNIIRLRRQALNFTMIGGELYKRSFLGPYLKCLSHVEADYALREVHSGVCGEHLGGRALALKIMRQGFYWPTMKQDALEFVKKCNECQLHSNLTHTPPVELSSLQSPWPFAQWGIDIMGPFPMATGQRKFIILAVDYFTKWVEAEPLAKITEANAKLFVWKNIVCRFGIPAKIITDNGTQFTGRVFTSFCQDLHIHLLHTAVAHPQANGQTEVTNRTILKGLKTRLAKAGGQWAEELPNVLWAYRTTSRTPTGETPYNLCFGTEAVIPIDIGVPSPRVQVFDAKNNEEKLRYSLDLLPETRDIARLKTAAYQQRVARSFNRRVKPRPISVGDLVLRSIESAGKGPQRNKLSPLWEGPYLVITKIKPGTFKLKDAEGKTLPRAWNATNLKKYYQ